MQGQQIVAFTLERTTCIRGLGLFSFAHIEHAARGQRTFHSTRSRAQAPPSWLNPLSATYFVDSSHFEEPDIFRITIQIPSQHVEHSRSHRSPHYARFFAQR